MGRGRPRKIEPEIVLEKAMHLFWQKGYEGTSMNDLVDMTGMAKPGLYGNFGDKEALYGKALVQYFDQFGGTSLEDLANSELPLEDSIRIFLEAIVDMLTDKKNPGGCFLINTLVETTNAPTSIKKLAQKFNQERCIAFSRRFEKARQTGELSTEVDIVALADFFASQSLAMGVMGRTGASKQTLLRYVDTALAALPTQGLNN